MHAKDNATTHPKIGYLKQTIWQLRAAKVAAALISSQAAALAHHLKPFSEL
jgi:hypothetical protein